MKFSSTVDALFRENRHLRRVIALLAVGIVILALSVLLLYDRPQKLVLRSSRGMEIVSLTPLARTESDVREAVRLMLKARLDTEAIAPEAFLSQRQLELRTAEQRELKSRGFTQAIIVRSVELRNGAAVANFDRVISVGEIRSAIQTKANLAFEEIEPNELNAYGLRLSMLAPIEPEAASGSQGSGAPNGSGNSLKSTNKGGSK